MKAGKKREKKERRKEKRKKEERGIKNAEEGILLLLGEVCLWPSLVREDFVAPRILYTLGYLQLQISVKIKRLT